MSVMSRDEYDRHCAEQLAMAGCPPDEIERLTERAYPKNTTMAVEELRFRGVDATARRVEDWAASAGSDLRIIGRMRAWYKSDIDAFAAALERDGNLLPSAYYRKERGMSWTEWRDMEERIEHERVAKICAALGVSDDELCAALAHGLGTGQWHPLSGMWDEKRLKTARAWFDKNRHADEYSECLAEITKSRRDCRERLKAWRARQQRADKGM